jgi:hypothetical protein
MGLTVPEEDVFNSNDFHGQNSHNQKASYVGRGRTVVKKNEHLTPVGSGETSRSKIEDGCDLFAGQIKPLHDVFNSGSRFEIRRIVHRFAVCQKDKRRT